MLIHTISLVFASFCKAQLIPNPEHENKSLGFVTLYICLCLTLLICVVRDLEEAFWDSEDSETETEDWELRKFELEIREFDREYIFEF